MDMPLDSNCGDDCKPAIDATWAAVATLDNSQRTMLLTAMANTANIFIFG